MDKKTIGILTHWIIPNYGAFMQAYALRNVLENLYPDYEVFQIAYMNNTHSKMYYGFEMHELYKMWPLNLSFYKDVFRRLKRRTEILAIRKFKSYYFDLIPHSDEYNKKSLRKIFFDNLVLGSDILWDYSIDFFDKDRYVFGIGINSDNKISYAASFGSVKSESKHPQYVIEGMKSLNAISVRDIKSYNIVMDITARKPEIHADPTLLWDFKNDEMVIDPAVEEPYIAVYGGDYTEEQIKVVKEYCRKQKYKIIHLESSGDKCSWCDARVEENKMTPFVWCGYIKNAKAIVTSAFHGLMFGLIYEKRILFSSTDFMISKAEWIINYLGLRVLIDDKSFRQQIKYDWNYKDINTKIDVLKSNSLSYLKKNII